ncbi:YbbR-like domain-containing protein [Prevotella sp. E13-17]|uniref:CdaR family protein n=1 Tax=Prevotella sp. E13-17 TaxID=2913616 RepID=UPI001EDB8254|nr:YbbR-like domain-containing protein [Prevotella sp. E13-17]UKK50246.1 YbbR-like domain-containing protein [Prevotella sp. E13-17]
MTLDVQYEQEIKIPVRYVNVPQNAVITSNEVDTLRVVVGDKGITLLGLLYGNSNNSIDIDFENFARSNGTGVISNIDLQKLIGKTLPASSRIVSVKPEKLVFYYNYGEKKKVPVRIQGQVIPEPLYFISETKYLPDSVTIYASRKKLENISVVYTEELHYENFHDTLTIETNLARLSGVKMVPNKVSVCFITDVLTEESIDNIPIVGINMPEGKVLRTFPAKVSITFVTGMKEFQSLTPDDFLVVADYEEFSHSESTKCNIYLKKVPTAIQQAKLSVNLVDYLIEDQ